MGEGERRENEATARPDDDPGREDGCVEQEISVPDYAIGDFADAGEQPPGPEDASGAGERGDPTYR